MALSVGVRHGQLKPNEQEVSYRQLRRVDWFPKASYSKSTWWMEIFVTSFGRSAADAQVRTAK